MERKKIKDLADLHFFPEQNRLELEFARQFSKCVPEWKKVSLFLKSSPWILTNFIPSTSPLIRMTWLILLPK
jgi:hypothetical protein